MLNVIDELDDYDVLDNEIIDETSQVELLILLGLPDDDDDELDDLDVIEKTLDVVLFDENEVIDDLEKKAVYLEKQYIIDLVDDDELVLMQLLIVLEIVLVVDEMALETDDIETEYHHIGVEKMLVCIDDEVDDEVDMLVDELDVNEWLY